MRDSYAKRILAIVDWRAFRWYWNQWPQTTLNYKDKEFSECFAIFSCGAHFKSELRRNG